MLVTLYIIIKIPLDVKLKIKEKLDKILTEESENFFILCYDF